MASPLPGGAGAWGPWQVWAVRRSTTGSGRRPEPGAEAAGGAAPCPSGGTADAGGPMRPVGTPLSADPAHPVMPKRLWCRDISLGRGCSSRETEEAGPAGTEVEGGQFKQRAALPGFEDSHGRQYPIASSLGTKLLAHFIFTASPQSMDH